jgi:hypothetical protein
MCTAAAIALRARNKCSCTAVYIKILVPVAQMYVLMLSRVCCTSHARQLGESFALFTVLSYISLLVKPVHAPTSWEHTQKTLVHV